MSFFPSIRNRIWAGIAERDRKATEQACPLRQQIASQAKKTPLVSHVPMLGF
jgi:hypothetical protein